MKETIYILGKILSKRQKGQLILLFIMILGGAVLETLGVSSLIPLLTAMMSPEILMNNVYVQSVCEMLKIESNQELVISMTIAIIVIFVIKNLYMIVLNYVQYRFIYNGQLKTTTYLVKEFMRKDYEFFLNNNYNYIAKIVKHDVVDEYNLLLCLVKFVTELIMFIALIIVLLFVDFKMTMVIAILLLAIIGCIFFIVKPAMKKAGDEARKNIVGAEKWMYQAFNGIKEAKITQKEQTFINKYNYYQQQYVNSQKINNILASSPTYIIEAFFVSGLLGYLLVLTMNGVTITSIIPQISAFAVAAIRLMPSANRMNSYINSAVYYKSLLKDIDVQIEEITKRKEIENKVQKTDVSKIKLQNKIQMKNITFAYQNSNKNIFERANMDIPVGKSVALVGTSGAGKTTIVDILLGLFKTQEGEILVDGVNIFDNYSSWLENIGYIPQVIYLMDDTIRNNVAYGIETKDIDDEKIWKALAEAQIADFVKTLPEGLNTIVGDRGVRISGGQRQRLGIARALYNDPAILIFDEATSALDNETESAIMESINHFQGVKTMIIIAHRLGTVKDCDMQYRVENGKIIREK